jgi:murein DD-endopeptidase MepM/ murein hydrolase activator NlpD
LQGVHAMQGPGFFPVTIRGELQGGEIFAYTQAMYVRDGDYLIDPVLKVSPETIDPAVTLPEDAQWQALTAPVTAQRHWQGKFLVPVPVEFAECYPSRFGSRRSYNGSSYDYFHTGLDFCGNTSTEIYAPAAGTVVFAGPLTVRGNATIIDHGWGIYSGYLHQSEIFVKAGDIVEAGQRIGLVGATGRATGPHLHLEVWVGGVQVDPMDWLTITYPSVTG